MDVAPPQEATGPTQLPPAAIELASKMFDAARKGDEQSVALLTQALARGLPANLTNDKGDTLVSHDAQRGLDHELRLLYLAPMQQRRITNI